MDIWSAVRDDRQALADLLGAAGPGGLDRATPCAAWTVADVAAHVLAMATVSKGAMLVTYVRAGLDLDVASQRQVEELRAEVAPDALGDELRSRAEARHTPPGLKPMGVLAEVVVHTIDVAVALERPAPVPAEHLEATLDYLARRVPGNTRFSVHGGRRHPVLDGEAIRSGLHLAARDLDWSRDDGAPVVTGSASHLILALAGRPAALDGLDGEGTGVLRTRLRSA